MGQCYQTTSESQAVIEFFLKKSLGFLFFFLTKWKVIVSRIILIHWMFYVEQDQSRIFLTKSDLIYLTLLLDKPNFSAVSFREWGL